MSNMTVNSIRGENAPLRILGAFVFLLVLAPGLVSDAQAGPRGGGGRMAQNSVSAANRDINRGGNTNHNSNININNNSNVNIDRDVDIDVDHHYDYDHHHHGAWAAAAVTAAIVVGATYYSLPPNCTTVYRNGIGYSYCGGYYYQPYYQGSRVAYVVVNP